MKYEYTIGLPYSKLKEIVTNDDVDELWLVFAYFSTNRILEILELIKGRKQVPILHLVLSASSVNPLQEIVDEIFLMASSYPNFNFHLVETPLMHSKLFASRAGEVITLYLGSGNLTNKAINSNIETGVILNFDSSQKSMKFITRLMKMCDTQNSIDNLQRKAIFSHFRSELLFLGLEESKLRSSIFVSPGSLKKIFSNSVENDPYNEDRTVNILTKRTLNIAILTDSDRKLILANEKLLKDAIKKYFSILINGYGWTSSYWSLKHLMDEDHPVNHIYNKFIEALTVVHDKYLDRKYRKTLAGQIRNDIYEWASEENFSFSQESTESVEEFISNFSLDIDQKKSPYKNIERIYKRSLDSNNLVSLLNPYKIGDDDIHSKNSEFDILSSDQVNLLVMCQLAIRLRSNKPPKVPSVWWFDVGLDKNIHSSYGYALISKYRYDTRMQLESLMTDIQDACDNTELNKCLDRYCEITGFNLGLKYPSISELMVWMDDEDTVEDRPYAFLDSSKKRYNIDIKNYNNIASRGIMLAFDATKIQSDWELDVNSLRKAKGRFVLGNNLLFDFDVELSPLTYLYINGLRPK
jgi:hypothetical protein